MNNPELKERLDADEWEKRKREISETILCDIPKLT